MVEKKFLTNKEAAELAGVSGTTWYKWIAIKPIGKVRLPGSTRRMISRETLLDYLKSMEEKSQD